MSYEPHGIDNHVRAACVPAHEVTSLDDEFELVITDESLRPTLRASTFTKSHHSTSVNVTLIMCLQQGHWIRLEAWNLRGVSSTSFIQSFQNMQYRQSWYQEQVHSFGSQKKEFFVIFFTYGGQSDHGVGCTARLPSNC